MSHQMIYFDEVSDFDETKADALIQRIGKEAEAAGLGSGAESALRRVAVITGHEPPMATYWDHIEIKHRELPPELDLISESSKGGNRASRRRDAQAQRRQERKELRRA